MNARGLALLGAALLGVGGYLAWPAVTTLPRVARLRAYLADPAAHAGWQLHAGERCGPAPFLMPTTGYLGFGYGDSFRPGHRHQGLDVFGPEGLGATPVVAAFTGYLTRLPEWKSSVILRLPHDPLNPGRQIWTYYTHMADPQGGSYIDPAFPPGTREVRVPAGTRLGFQGNYSGDPDSPTGVHLHFSIVLDDGRGGFRNELKIENTLDPLPYLGLAPLDSGPVVCAGGV